MTKLAYDRLPTKFSWRDEDDHLFIDKSPITKVQIRSYRGIEIPDYEKRGWKADKVYKLLCPAEELEKAADTFNKHPIHLGHVHVTAENPHIESLVGTIGESASFEYPYLFNSMGIWRADAIKGIKNGTTRELSCSYRYEVDPTPGVFEGEAYDGIMRNIRGNHVALVEKGRAGPDVYAWDHLPTTLQGKPMKPIKLDGATRHTMATLFYKLSKSGKLAMDASPEEIDRKLKEAADEDPDIDTSEDEEPNNSKKPEGQDQDPDDDQNKPQANDESETSLTTPKPVSATTAMDSADVIQLIDKRVNEEVSAAKIAMDAAWQHKLNQQRDIMKAAEQARIDVMPVTGNILATDSAYDDLIKIYQLALDHWGVDTSGVAKDIGTYRVLFQTARAGRQSPGQQASRSILAQDSASSQNFYQKMGLKPMQSMQSIGG